MRHQYILGPENGSDRSLSRDNRAEKTKLESTDPSNVQESPTDGGSDSSSLPSSALFRASLNSTICFGRRLPMRHFGMRAKRHTNSCRRKNFSAAGVKIDSQIAFPKINSIWRPV